MLKKPLVDLKPTGAPSATAGTGSVGEGASSSGTPATSAAPSPAPTPADKPQVSNLHKLLLICNLLEVVFIFFFKLLLFSPKSQLKKKMPAQRIIKK